MKVPGCAWLEFEVEPREGGAAIWLTALFHPMGPAGLAHRYPAYPLHRIASAGMREQIADAAEAGQTPAPHA